MAESRDRLSRSIDETQVAESYICRLTSVGRIGVLPDVDGGERSITQTPFSLGSTPLTGDASGQRTGQTRVLAIRGNGSGRGLFGTPVTSSRGGGRIQNTPTAGGSFRRGRGGRSGSLSVLPYWYPHSPLQDITHVVRAIERRGGLGDGDGPVIRSPISGYQLAGRGRSLIGAQLEHESSYVTPKPKLAIKMFKPSPLGKVPSILSAITENAEGGFELTPQKKLLNSIDIVEKAVMAELNRLKRTPAAK
ncbi:protein GIGAS CELL1-like [Bidens hawaiensis]|uniref:protein GIGAS CELL1-like n=1 Tax=Bidens hawaiensis TaxID=980011 RepID=UPI00404B606F